MQHRLEKFLKNLPETPGILGRNKYHNTAVLIPLMWQQEQLFLILEKRAPHIRQGDEISFPGGHFSKSEDNNTQDTAMRETSEELGISTKKIKVLGQFDSLVAPVGSIIDVFIGELKIEKENQILPNLSEVQSILKIPFTFFIENEPEIYKVKLEIKPYHYKSNGEKITTFPAQKLQVPSRYHKPWGGKLQNIYVYKFKGEVIWGITAEIIYEMIKIWREYD
ncbi:MAG: CoA pyrophosphatase [Candidatus Cloacimonadota bacterium]|nr:CoA pyrophosphatase [Candidatus Cloacimonadota bacterium]